MSDSQKQPSQQKEINPWVLYREFGRIMTQAQNLVELYHDGLIKSIDEGNIKQGKIVQLTNQLSEANKKLDQLEGELKENGTKTQVSKNPPVELQQKNIENIKQ